MKQFPHASRGLHIAVVTFQFFIQSCMLSVFQQVGSSGRDKSLHFASVAAVSCEDGITSTGIAMQLTRSVVVQRKVKVVAYIIVEFF